MTGVDGVFLREMGGQGSGARKRAPSLPPGARTADTVGGAYLSSSLLSLVFLRVAIGPHDLRGNGGGRPAGFRYFGSPPPGNGRCL